MLLPDLVANSQSLPTNSSPYQQLFLPDPRLVMSLVVLQDLLSDRQLLTMIPGQIANCFAQLSGLIANCFQLIPI